MEKIICRYRISGTEEQFDSLDEAIKALDAEVEACCDNEQLAANIYEVYCDLLEARDSGELEDWAEPGETVNFVFER